MTEVRISSLCERPCAGIEETGKAIRVRLQLEERRRDLALFNLALDSKLRGCDLVRLQVNDVCVGGQVRDRATVIQRKTGRPVQFEITEQTRAAIRDWVANSVPGNIYETTRRKAEAILKEKEAARLAGMPKPEPAPGSLEYQALHPEWEWKPEE